MRTTMDLVLEIARGRAAHRRQSLGKVISEMFRKNLQGGGTKKLRNGVKIILRPGKAKPVTLEIVNKLHEEGPRAVPSCRMSMS